MHADAILLIGLLAAAAVECRIKFSLIKLPSDLAFYQNFLTTCYNCC